MNENELVYAFYLKDEFGQEFKHEHKVHEHITNNITNHLDQFKYFLLSIGYSSTLVDKITYENKE